MNHKYSLYNNNTLFTGAVTEDKQKNESRFKAVLECTDYYAEVLGLEQTSGDNFTFNIQIPYHPKATGEKNVIEMGFRGEASHIEYLLSHEHVW